MMSRSSSPSTGRRRDRRILGCGPRYGQRVLIRETTVADVAGMDRIRRSVEPWHVATVETQERWFQGNPPEAQVFRVCVPAADGLDAYAWCKLDLYAGRP